MAPAAVNAAGISPDDLGVIRRQAAAFEEAKTRLPDLARLVSEKDWVFTRNLLHGPMQEVSREMLYINQRLDKSERKEATKVASSLKEALADLSQNISVEVKFVQTQLSELMGENFRQDASSMIQLESGLPLLGVESFVVEDVDYYSALARLSAHQAIPLYRTQLQEIDREIKQATQQL